jgi:sugar lactone lactonase YvrE
VRTILLALTALAALALGGANASTREAFPQTIPLPNGFQPEGIAIAGTTFYVGSIPTGAIYRGSLRSGRGSVFVPGEAGKAAVGMDLDRGRLVVAGGPTGEGYVYDARTGEELARFTLTTGQTFVNDVVVARGAAWFTDSINQVLYRVPLARPGKGRPGPGSPVEPIPLTGDIAYTTGFNANGIDATRNGKTLVLVQSNKGKLFTVTRGGVTREIDLGGGSVVNGDGILLAGRTLYVVQNRDDRIARIRLDPRLRSGRITGFVTDPDFDVPTTIDDHGKRLYAVNARFGTPPTPDTRYDVVQVSKR